ncbi:MAG: hypothetical protein HPY50_16875 [Firmicutes bacterium]|nr:hypothetical protein [Bacillota bacterium]
MNDNIILRAVFIGALIGGGFLLVGLLTPSLIASGAATGTAITVLRGAAQIATKAI